MQHAPDLEPAQGQSSEHAAGQGSASALAAAAAEKPPPKKKKRRSAPKAAAASAPKEEYATALQEKIRVCAGPITHDLHPPDRAQACTCTQGRKAGLRESIHNFIEILVNHDLGVAQPLPFQVSRVDFPPVSGDLCAARRCRGRGACAARRWHFGRTSGWRAEGAAVIETGFADTIAASCQGEDERAPPARH